MDFDFSFVGADSVLQWYLNQRHLISMNGRIVPESHGRDAFEVCRACLRCRKDWWEERGSIAARRRRLQLVFFIRSGQ